MSEACLVAGKVGGASASSLLRPDVLGSALTRLWRFPRSNPSRRPRSGRARGQPHGPALHGRRIRQLSLCGPACSRSRQPARLPLGRRRTALRRRAPDSGLSMSAPGQSASPGGALELPGVPRPRMVSAAAGLGHRRSGRFGLRSMSEGVARGR